jgi:transaldolase
MKKQALEIASWGSNVYVKIPITNTRGESSVALVQELVKENVKVNSTAIFTLEQVREISEVLSPDVPSYVSVFAGRIADTGVDPIPLMSDVISKLDRLDKCEVIWASPRELLNIFHADSIGCHVITVTNDILKKIHLIGRDLSEYSLETVQMFYDDAVSAGYKL